MDAGKIWGFSLPMRQLVTSIATIITSGARDGSPPFNDASTPSPILVET